MDISVVIPAYNEPHRLPDTVRMTALFVSGKFGTSEIVVVEDGSMRPVKSFIDKYHPPAGVTIRYIEHYPNRGKGYSVRSGILAAEGDLIAFLDADGSTPIEELEKLLAAINGGADIAIGSRALETPDTIVEKQLHRFLMGSIFTFFVRTIAGVSVRDSQCGFKLFKGAVARELFRDMDTDGFAFDVEVLARAGRKGYAVREIAVNWYDVAGSKVRLVRDSAKMFFDLFRIAMRVKR